MGRTSRKIQLWDGCIAHKTWHAHNDEFNLSEPEDKAEYLNILFKKISTSVCSIHAFNIMDNHSHELYTVHNVKLFSDFMRIHHTIYGQRFNKRHARKGKVANERPSTTAVYDRSHEIISVLYIHANIFRIKSVKDPENFEWSSHHLYAYGSRNEYTSKIIFPDWYIDLGNTDAQRQKIYRDLFENYIQDPEELVKMIYSDVKSAG